MISFFVRYLKRLVVLLPGIFITYISIEGIFPTLDSRLPLSVAILITYALGAYILIPAVIRFGRILLPARHPPTYSVTPDGFASDPVNIGVVGTKAQLVSSMKAAGWSVADHHTLVNVFREIFSVLTGKSYLSAPMSYLYLLGRHQDIGFEIQISGSRGMRHHVRFWATRFDAERPLQRQHLGHNRHKPDTTKPVLWLGAASRDVGFALIKHNVQISHMIHPDTDQERDMIVKTLRKAGELVSVETVRVNEPYRLVNRVWRGYLEADGVVAVCHVKPLR
ncbi:MAG: hypothetical protein JWM37_41 [Candidatus Saccharibacteria bacterium]|nr:hypothetical protein [Candidatus Saccharibacteria bacterium]